MTEGLDTAGQAGRAAGAANADGAGQAATGWAAVTATLADYAANGRRNAMRWKRRSDASSAGAMRFAMAATLAILPSGCATTTVPGDAGCISYAEAWLARPPAATVAEVPPDLARWITDLSFTTGEIGLPWNLAVRPATRPVSDPSYTTLSLTPSGGSLRPFAPGHLAAKAEPSGDITLTWTRRSRDPAADSWEATEVPLLDQPEAWEVDILDGASVKRTLTASVTSTIAIPARAIAFCVSTRTTAAVTGATSYDCGVAGSPSKFGGSLGIAAAACNLGVIWPEPFWADTPILLTANGADFTGGAVRLAIHALQFVVPG